MEKLGIEVTNFESNIIYNMPHNEPYGIRRVMLFLLMSSALGFLFTAIIHKLIEPSFCEISVCFIVITAILFIMIELFDVLYMRLYKQHCIYCAVANDVIRRHEKNLGLPSGLGDLRKGY